MVISRADRAINLCEMKFALGKRFFPLYIRKFPYDIYSEDLKGGPYVTTKNLHRQERHKVCPLHQRKDCNPGPQKPNLGNKGLQVKEFP